MKLITTVTCFCCCFMILRPFNVIGQQPWMNNVRDRNNPKFYEVQQSFNEYWNTRLPQGHGKGTIPKSKGYKQFKRWEWFWEPRVGKSGVFPNSYVVMEEWEKYRVSHPGVKKLSPGRSSFFSGNQPYDTEASPLPAASDSSGEWVPLGPSASGGGYGGVGRLNAIAFHPSDPNTFWVGSPGGGLWKTTTGGTSWTTLTDNLQVLGVSIIVIDPSNPNTMYIGTGDRDGGDTYSVGILKSTDGGISWNATGLSYNSSQRQQIKGIIMHPTNPLTLIVAASDGIYRTTDGGDNWTLEQSGNFQEILFKPGDPSTIYASRIGNAQIFKSTDTGNSWASVTSFSGIYRVALAVTPANPSIVGALCSNNSDYGFGGYYTSSNSGASFQLAYAASTLNLLGWSVDGTDAGGQGYYDLCLAISPTNANVVYAGGVNTWKSTNGGAAWAINTMWYGGTGVPAVHADKHYMAFNPLTPATLYQCSDGGVYKTSDGGSSWTDLTNGLQITQFYRLGNSATNANLIISGTQDNGTKIRNGANFTDVIGGDGMEAIIDHASANIMYGSLYYGQIFKSTNSGGNFTDITTSLPYGAWVSPYVMDPANSQILYAGLGGNVYKTTNAGSSWAALSGAFSGNDLQSLAVAPGNAQTIYAGSYYTLYKTTTGGASWSSVALPSSEALTSIEVHATNPQIAWITFSGYSAGNKIFKTENGGLTWTNFSGTLPNLPVNTIELDKNTGVLYIGNDVGVFVRHPDMQDWQVFDSGLPNVVVNELEIQYSSGLLRAATYGRGLWESPLFLGTVTATYCLPTYNVGCSDNDYINNFSFNTLVNNSSLCGSQTGTGYTNYAPAGTLTTSVERGESYSINLQSGSFYSQGFGVWIDYNQDMDFDDAGEFVYASPTVSTSTYTASITIPGAATLGATRMRVRCAFVTLFNSAQACANFNWGEAEDYTITIIEGSGTNQAPSVYITSPANNAAYLAGSNITIEATASDPDGTIPFVKFYNGSVLLHTDSTSPYSHTIDSAVVGTYSFTAKTTDDSSLTANSATVAVSVTKALNKAPVVNIISPVRNASYVAPATITIKVAATDQDGIIKTIKFYNGSTLLKTISVTSSDPLIYSHTINNAQPGNYKFYATATDDDGLASGSASLPVFVVSASASKAPFVNITSPVNNGTYPSFAPLTILATASDPDGAVAFVKFYNGPILLLTDSTNPYSCPIASLAAGNYSFTAKATDNSGLTTNSATVAISTSGAANKAPLVTITSPANNANYLARATVTIKAAASDSDGTIKNVKFYNGATLLTTDSVFPYSYAIINAEAGAYKFYAAATDSNGLISGSASVSVFVTKPSTSKAPLVNITSPLNNATYLSPAFITLNATASDADDSVAFVKFYNGSILLHTDSSSPYSYSMDSVSAGSYSFIAKATDYSGLTTNSATVAVSVSAIVNKAPAVSITSPANNSNYPAPATLTIDAAASDLDGTIKNVKFYNGSTLLKTDSVSPYSHTINNAPAGIYKVYASATDDDGSTSGSASVTVFVADQAAATLSKGPAVVSSNLPVKNRGLKKDEAFALKLTPNPVKNLLKVSVRGLQAQKGNSSRLLIISTSGVIMKSIQLSAFTEITQVDVSALLSGMYIIKMVSGSKIMFERFVKL